MIFLTLLQVRSDPMPISETCRGEIFEASACADRKKVFPCSTALLRLALTGGIYLRTFPLVMHA